MRELILKTARRYFVEIGVTDVLFREMSWRGETCERGEPVKVACNGTWLKT